nr:class I SAM-dependent methyltransferase [Collinsella urealyticum]
MVEARDHSRAPVLYAEAELMDAAQALASRLQLPLANSASRPLDVLATQTRSDTLFLHLGAAGLSIMGSSMLLLPDFSLFKPRIRPDRLGRELVVRAVRIRGAETPVRVVDATAGLGEDAFLLAAAGFEVCMCEQNPIIAALLEDALRRAQQDLELAPIAARMRLIAGDAREILLQLDAAPDVVYLDPMFPERKKRSAVKKKLQLLQQLEEPCDVAAELLDAAIGAHPRKIVIKRPAKGPHLGQLKPAYSVAGKAIRFDVIP